MIITKQRFIFNALFLFFIFITAPALFAQEQAPLPLDSQNFMDVFSPQTYKSREIHNTVEVRVIGQGAQRVYLFVPSGPLPENTVPLVLFHHGWLGMNPMNFGALIDHLTRSGHAVIFPVYQLDAHTPPTEITENAGMANRQALNVLSQEFGLIPQLGRTIYYGFSIGSAISVNLALQAPEYGLPQADALILVAPGDAYHVGNGRWPSSIYGRLENLPATLPVVIMTGADDDIGLPTAQKLNARLSHIPREHRIMYILPSSSHQSKRVAAGHGSPGAPDSRYNFRPNQTLFPQQLLGRANYEVSASLNQLDFWGYWKIINGVVDGLATQQFPSYVFGYGSATQLSLGYWVDGTPLNPMQIEEINAKQTGKTSAPHLLPDESCYTIAVTKLKKFTQEDRPNTAPDTPPGQDLPPLNNNV